jgi:hypothetical protein
MVGAEKIKDELTVLDPVIIDGAKSRMVKLVREVLGRV